MIVKKILTASVWRPSDRSGAGLATASRGAGVCMGPRCAWPPRLCTYEQSEALPHARLHDLRHVHATTLLLAGVPVHVVAAWLGHADPSITLRVYAHLISDQLTEAADIFARAVAATT